ncbi:MAG: sigma-54 dependent transcriptional regulator [Bryobacter sp.]|nr:sigma-54 dependent transcriptional regulator [Bryobacter sp.]
MPAAKPRILIADDQSDVLEALRLLLKPEGYEIETVTSPADCLRSLEKREYDLVIIDLNYTRDTTSGEEGMELLTKIQDIDSLLPVIVMTAWGSVPLAVEAMRRGARDFLTKPWENERILPLVRTQLDLSKALKRQQRLEAENLLLRDDSGIVMIAKSPAMAPVIEILARVGPADANVLITGEPGVGKEVVARKLHALSPRAVKAMVSVNAGGLAEGVFESELFGHVKGAFTDAKTDRVGRFELADTGTLFLDEIGNLSPAMQAKLLRVLETGEMERVGSSRTKKVDVRVISATNANLDQDVAQGRFRQDLLFRLNTIEIHIPPLRDRRDDILPLADFFLDKHATRYRKALAGFDHGAQQALLDHKWPGNVRELNHVVERGVLMAGGTLIRAQDLVLRAVPAAAQRLEDMSLEDVEAHLIKKALDRYKGNVSAAAEALGLSRSALYRRLQRYNLHRYTI